MPISSEDLELKSLVDQTPPGIREVAPNGYNPSWLETQEYFIFSVRQSSKQTRILEFAESPITSGKGAQSARRVNSIGEIDTRIGDVIVKDLRFFAFEGTAWLTFNTGHPKNPVDSNEIFLAPYRDLGRMPFRAIFPGRQRIEKNWAFYGREGSLYAIYSASPLVVLRAVTVDEVKREIHFIRETGPKHEGPDNSYSLTLASQPIVRGEELWFMVHEKVYQFGKFRAYFPRLLKSELLDGFPSRTEVGPRLFHSVANLKSPSESNKFAFGVTYASGLQIDDERALIGYGIADSRYKIVQLSLSEFGNQHGR